MSVLVGFDLLDRQILDRDDRPVGKVDDVELATDGGAPYITALLVGPQALGRRLGGALGRAVSGLAERLRSAGHPDPIRIPFHLVAEVDSAVKLSVRRELLTEPALETWLREHLIERIPGAHHAGE